MRINRFFTLFLSLVLLLSLAACGEKETVVENDPGKEIVQEESAKDPVVKEEPEKKEETPAEKAEESKPAGGKSETAGEVGGAKGESEKLSAEVTPEAPAKEETSEVPAKEETSEAPAKEETTESAGVEETVAGEKEEEEIVFDDAVVSTVITSGSVPVVEVAEVASEAELLSAMKDAKVSEIKVTQNISVGETITVSGTKTISGAKITASKKLALMYEVPAGAELIIKQCVVDGAGKATQFVMNYGKVSVSNTEIKNFTGRAVYNVEGALMALNYVTASNCRGGAVESYSDLVVKNSRFANNSSSQNGSAILAGLDKMNKTKIENCQFEKNTSATGGALFLNNAVYIDGCTFVGNRATSKGGAISCNNSVVGLITNCVFEGNNTSGNAGAIYTTRVENTCATVRIEKCSFTGNTAAKVCGGVDNYGRMSIIDSTFTNNSSTAQHGGALNNDEGATISLVRTSFTGNVAGRCGGAVRNSGDMSFEKCAFTGNTSKGDGGGAYYSLNTGAALFADCKFVGNKALNADGVGGGAVYMLGSSSQVSGAAFENCTFTENETATAGGGIYGRGWMEITKCTFSKNTSGASAGAIYNRGNLKMYDTDVVDNSGGANGGAFRNQGGLGYIENCYFARNYNKSSGGAAYFNTTSETKVVGCTFEDNKSDSSGGAVYLGGDTTDGLSKSTFEKCVFRNNTAKTYGGAVRNNGELTIRECEMTKNHSGQRGGALYCNGLSSMNMSGCLVQENVCDEHGGAMYFYGYAESESEDLGEENVGEEFAGMTSRINLVDTKFIDNEAMDDLGRGGAIYNRGDVSLSRVVFEGNVCGYQGGAFYNNGILDAEDSQFIDCHANPEKIVRLNSSGSRLLSRGGAIYMPNGKSNKLTLDSCLFDGCSSLDYGGAISINANVGGNFSEIVDCDFVGNTVQRRGGALANSGGITTVKHCSFTDNVAQEYQGGAIFNGDSYGSGIYAPGRLTVVDCEIIGNAAMGANGNGGGIGCDTVNTNGVPGELTISGTTITGNSTSGYGGGISSTGRVTVLDGNVIHSNSPEDGELCVYGERGTLTVKGSGNDVASVRLGEGKRIIASTGADLGNPKLYLTGNALPNDSIFEGNGGDELGGSTSSGDGRYEVGADGKLTEATHGVTLPAGVSGAASATYDTDYTFTVPSGNNEVIVTVDGKKVPVTVSGTSCSVDGKYITGDVVITVTEISVPGDIAADAEAYVLDGSAIKAQGTLAEVVAAAAAGDVVYLCKADVALGTDLSIDKDITLATVSGTPVTVTLAPAATINVTADVMLQGKSNAVLTFNGSGAARENAAFLVTGSE
ncbi:MAG: hypothetical protein IIV78_04280, partial [Oscillospiraceae bacterium]|nr:hypothetical protein [Oscillospiraceae bacterium]